ncbi:MAG: DUF2321 domain-containing protein, partial [Candidatus Omnitrophica bacterium]|nr:DUF2321 domain-containing protein [Candidatus Omnitrophota bacterium]
KRCPKCGAQTISQCPKCSTNIRGYEHIQGVAHSGPSKPPQFCHECGASYPWTSIEKTTITKEGSKNKNQKIIEAIEDFKKDVSFYFTNAYDDYGKDTTEVRAKIAKNSQKIKEYLKNAGVATTISGRAAPAAGGFPLSYDLIDDMLLNERGPYAVDSKHVLDVLNKAIGIYESEELPNKSPAPSEANLREGFFVDGQYYEAQKFIRGILKKSKKSINIIDNYIDASVIDLLTAKPSNVNIEILTNKVAPDVKTVGLAFVKQYGKLSIRTSSAFHDRFLIVDGKDFYHLGASIKDLGNRTFMFSLMEEKEMINLLNKKWANEWQKGSVIV